MIDARIKGFSECPGDRVAPILGRYTCDGQLVVVHSRRTIAGYARGVRYSDADHLVGCLSCGRIWQVGKFAGYPALHERYRQKPSTVKRRAIEAELRAKGAV